MQSRERLRASDIDRERAVEFLHDAATEGRLSADELDDRVARAFAATTYGELDLLVGDLPIPVRPEPMRPTRADWWPRFAAAMIDSLIVGLVWGLLISALHFGSDRVLALLVTAAYFTILEGGPGGAGVGKRALGLRVVDQRTGGPIGYPRAFVRWLIQICSALICFLGYFWMLWDPDKQCWHDKLAGDVVVHTDGRQEPEPRRRLR
ncbi:MAG TPA: RDD family protein [Solirubrobacteraceae bacterium]|jgi:uncharacterized RDD family membrane protein YckC